MAIGIKHNNMWEDIKIQSSAHRRLTNIRLDKKQSGLPEDYPECVAYFRNNRDSFSLKNYLKSNHPNLKDKDLLVSYYAFPGKHNEGQLFMLHPILFLYKTGTSELKQNHLPLLYRVNTNSIEGVNYVENLGGQVIVPANGSLVFNRAAVGKDVRVLLQIDVSILG